MLLKEVLREVEVVEDNDVLVKDAESKDIT
jgi:hypothetical protein